MMSLVIAHSRQPTGIITHVWGSVMYGGSVSPVITWDGYTGGFGPSHPRSGAPDVWGDKGDSGVPGGLETSRGEGAQSSLRGDGADVL